MIPYTKIVLDFNMRAGSRMIIRLFGSPNVGVRDTWDIQVFVLKTKSHWATLIATF